MSESLVGASVAATRRNAGRSLNGFAPRPPPRLLVDGGVNAPGATFCADVIAACGIDNDARLSQVAPAARAADAITSARLIATRMAGSYSVFFGGAFRFGRSEEHTSELQSPCNIVCRLLLEKKTLGERINLPFTDSEHLPGPRTIR